MPDQQDTDRADDRAHHQGRDVEAEVRAGQPVGHVVRDDHDWFQPLAAVQTAPQSQPAASVSG